MNRLKKWFERLARNSGLGITPAEYYRRQKRKRHRALVSFLHAVPEDCYKLVSAHVRPGCYRDMGQGFVATEILDFDRSGLRDLVLLVERGEWEPTLPAALLEAVCRFECLRCTSPRCPDCRLPLPYASGQWTGPDDRRWQGILLPFTRCPACDADVRPALRWCPDYLPLVPKDGWTFRCQDSGCSHGEQVHDAAR
jgi:hypothetical protein